MTKRAIALSQAGTLRDVFMVSMLLMAVSCDDDFTDEPFNPGGSEEGPSRRTEHVSMQCRDAKRKKKAEAGS